MTISVTFTDGGTGQTAGYSGPATLLIGVAAMNTGYSVGNIYPIGSIDDIRTVLKNGPLAAYAAQYINLAGPTLYVYAVAGTAGRLPERLPTRTDSWLGVRLQELSALRPRFRFLWTTVTRGALSSRR